MYQVCRRGSNSIWSRRPRISSCFVCWILEMLKFYYEPFSQPSRAVWMLLEATGVPYTPCYVDLVAGMYVHLSFYKISLCIGDNLKDDFLKVSPTGKVPAINDDGFCLIERSDLAQFLLHSLVFLLPL